MNPIVNLIYSIPLCTSSPPSFNVNNQFTERKHSTWHTFSPLYFFKVCLSGTVSHRRSHAVRGTSKIMRKQPIEIEDDDDEMFLNGITVPAVLP